MNLRAYAWRQVEKHLDQFDAMVREVTAATTPDSIHDLRVATRRVSQALRIFKSALPAKAARRIRQQLGDIRGEAAALRDGDVMQELFTALGLAPEHALFAEIAARRSKEEAELKKSLGALAETGYAAEWRTALRKGEDGSTDALSYAHDRLPQQTTEYFAEGRRIVARRATAPQLHQFRILTKRFRYTLEMFAEMYGPALDVRLGRLRSIQDTLGKLNDCAVAARMLRPLDRQHPLLGRLADEVKTQDAAFRQYWSTTLDAFGEEQLWFRYVKFRGTPPESS